MSDFSPLSEAKRNLCARSEYSPLTRNGHSTAFYALGGLAPLGTNRGQLSHPNDGGVDGHEQDATSARARRQALLLITLVESVPQALNVRLCVGANPYIRSRRVFDDRQALAGRPGGDLST